MCFSLSATAFAADTNDVHVLVDTPPVSEDIVPFGAKPPTSANGTHYLGSGEYSYSVQSVGAQVYTDRWLIGAKTIECTVGGYKHVDGSPGYNYEVVTFTVYNSKNKVIAKNSVKSGQNQFSCRISGIPSNEKVYVKISVTQDNISKSFYGSISKIA